MAGNDWINSYLEAILDVGPGLGEAKSSLLLRERGRFSPTRYFVEEVITGFDETDLHRSWVRVCASDQESAGEEHEAGEHVLADLEFGSPEKAVMRLLYLLFAPRLEGEEAQRMAKRRLERERGRREAVADMSEDLSEGEKGDTVGDLSSHGESNRGRLPRISSVDTMEAWAKPILLGKVLMNYVDRLKLLSVNLHGLIRGENMELGRDSDTGGQVKYVVELARALASMPGVYRVDLLTRQVSSPDVDWSYGEPTEMLPPRNSEGLMDEMGESSGAYIVRIPFGPKDKYVPKELLWPHIPEFVDGALSHIIQMSKVLGEQIGNGYPVWPVAIHGHYADAGDSAALLSGALNVPMLFTGHSLGRDKLEQLLRQGRVTRDEINSTYKIMRRIEAEELSLDASEIVITSTRQEIDEQWRLYDGFDPILELLIWKVQDHGCVIPPGMEFHHIIPHDGDMDAETEASEDGKSPDPPIWAEIMRFFSNPRKPMILALARPDPKKNLMTLVKAFGECRPLRELANLTLIMGNRDNIDEMTGTSASVLLSILKLIDKYDLYGQVAYPKHHKQHDVPEIYRLAAKTKGVFINPAFIEPFGLTLIEVLDNGLLVDPHNQQSIADALLKLVADKHLWAKSSCKPRQPRWLRNDDDDENSESDSPSDSLRDIQDISLNLKFSFEGDKNETRDNIDDSFDSEDRKRDQNSSAGKFPALRRRKHIFVIAVDTDASGSLSESVRKIFAAVDKERTEGSVGFILATSFNITEIRSFLISEKLNPIDFDAFICNSGGDLYYSSLHSEDNPFVVDLYYHSHIEYRWGGEGLRKTLVRWASSIVDKRGEKEEHIVVEDEEASADYCYSFKVQRAGVVPPVKELRKLMRIQALRCHVIHCQNGSKINVIPVWLLVPKHSEFEWYGQQSGMVICRGEGKRGIRDDKKLLSDLGYLYLRWGMDLSKVVVFVGESGDTDYEGLLGGVHKSVVLTGVCSSDQPTPCQQKLSSYRCCFLRQS
ncbi:hypothetical protein DH2020_010781 [Rehmannia glutinosa]|uniref:sucrose-phosphate synthase n=1 Tax=Rehmannia glutinosa TaxID=99300 RepID=A0ABR0XBK1_REHGL